MLASSTKNGCEVHKMDIEASFLNGDLKETMYMTQLEEYVVNSQEHQVFKPIKSLYGLKEAP